MNVKVETIASIIAIIISIGTIFYHAVVVKRNVEILSIQSDKSEGNFKDVNNNFKDVNNKIQINDKEIQLVKNEVKFYKERFNEIHSIISGIQQVILESNQETRKILIKSLESN